VFSSLTSKVRSNYCNDTLPFIRNVKCAKERWSTVQRTYKGHGRGVYSVAFSPDGTLLASASKDRTVRIWSITTGAEKHILRGHTDHVRSVAFPPGDNTTVVSASDDKTIRIWNVVEGTHELALADHRGPVLSAAFSRDGKAMASASTDGILRLWDMALRKLKQVFTYHSNTDVISQITSRNRVRIAFSPNDTTVPLTDFITVQLWEIATGKCQILGGESSKVNSIAFSPDSGTLASASEDGVVQRWDTISREKKLTLQHYGEGPTSEVCSVAFSPDGNSVAWASDDCRVRHYDIAKEKCFLLRGHKGRVHSVAFSPDGDTFASASEDGIIKLWDAAPGECSVSEDYSEYFSRVVISPDGSVIASALYYYDVALWNATTGEYL